MSAQNASFRTGVQGLAIGNQRLTGSESCGKIYRLGSNQLILEEGRKDGNREAESIYRSQGVFVYIQHTLIVSHRSSTSDRIWANKKNDILQSVYALFDGVIRTD